MGETDDEIEENVVRIVKSREYIEVGDVNEVGEYAAYCPYLV